MKKAHAFLMLLLPFFLRTVLFAHEVSKEDGILFSGTILSYTARNVPPGHLVFEQFLFSSRTYGLYDKNSELQKDRNFHQNELIPYIKFGIINGLDFNIITSVVSSHSKKIETISLGDTLVLFGLQVMRSQKDSWIPDIRFLFGESFPTGRYERLDPNMHGADGVGSGSFEATFILSAAKAFPIGNKHALRFNPNLFFIIPASTHISDFSVYGGGSGTRGTVKPGAQIAFDFPCEYNITNHIVLGLDIFYIHKDRTIFNPKVIGTPLSGLPSSENFSLLPSIEYNPSESFGIEAGVWFSISGRNSFAFTTGSVVAWWVF